MYFWAIASTWTFRSRAKRSLGQHAVLVALCLDQPLEVVERELGVDRDEPVDLDHGVHPLAVAEPVLELVSAGGKPVAQQVREQELAEAAARLRWPEGLLEPLEVVRAGEDLLVRASELARAGDGCRPPSSRCSRAAGRASRSSPRAAGRPPRFARRAARPSPPAGRRSSVRRLRHEPDRSRRRGRRMRAG